MTLCNQRLLHNDSLKQKTCQGTVEVTHNVLVKIKTKVFFFFFSVTARHKSNSAIVRIFLCSSRLGQIPTTLPLFWGHSQKLKPTFQSWGLYSYLFFLLQCIYTPKVVWQKCFTLSATYQRQEAKINFVTGLQLILYQHAVFNLTSHQ